MDKPLNPMDKQLIASRFAKARNTYTREARVQQQVAEKMMQLIKEPYTRFHRVVEFGCGTGSYSRILLHTLQPETLLLNDLCREMEECVKELCDGTTVQFVPGDAEAIDFPAVELLDQINLMTYDCDGPIHSSYAFAESCLNYWLEERHFPPEKLTLGLPFYGRPFPGAFKDLLLADPDALEKDTVEMPQGSVRYNGRETLTKKVALAKERLLAGIMFWEISLDADDHQKSLLKVLGEAMNA